MSLAYFKEIILPLRLQKTVYSISFFLLPLAMIAQPTKPAARDSMLATMLVEMTNSKKEPQKGEQVIFYAKKTKKSFIVTTDKDGKASLQLPPGDEYMLKLKSMQDTANYSAMEIPALGPRESFGEPYSVSIEYDPPMSFTLENVQFDVNKATLRPASYKQLDELATYLQWKEGIKVEIAGHTDNDGQPADNMRLSQQRAEIVKAYLIKKGIPASLLTAKGYGDTQPVADNNTAEGRQKNRRTEARLKE